MGFNHKMDCGGGGARRVPKGSLESDGRREGGRPTVCLRRRDGGEYLPFCLADVVAPGRASVLLCTQQPWSEHNNTRQHECEKDGTLAGSGGSDRSCSLRGLRREDARADVAAGADCGHGQLQCPQGARVQELVEEQGCELLYLSPYSPDLNPIEEAFGKVKGILRKAEARSRHALVEAMGRALDAITSRDARGFSSTADTSYRFKRYDPC